MSAHYRVLLDRLVPEINSEVRAKDKSINALMKSVHDHFSDHSMSAGDKCAEYYKALGHETLGLLIKAHGSVLMLNLCSTMARIDISQVETSKFKVPKAMLRRIVDANGIIRVNPNQQGTEKALNEISEFNRAFDARDVEKMIEAIAKIDKYLPENVPEKQR